MMTRAEKLFNIRAQVQKAVSEIEHGAVFSSTLALADALSAVLTFLEEEHEEVEALTKLVEELHSPFQHRADERQKSPPMLVGTAKGEQIVDIHPVGEEVKPSARAQVEGEPHQSRIKVKK